VLRAERPALNLLGHLSGIATLTRTYVEWPSPHDPVHAQDAAGPPGGGARSGRPVAGPASLLLSDAILIKDTHVRSPAA
jgi:nicotinate-nucleotide pyrophosphorylase (carboxylating)